MKKALKIVSIVGLLFWMACCYLGLFFATGNYLITIVVTLLIGVAMFLSYLLMLKLQDKGATQGNRDRARASGLAMLGVYVVASLVSAFYINHLVKTFEYKEEIQNEAKEAVNELRVTFNKEKDNPVANSYRDWVNKRVGDLVTHLEAIDYEGKTYTLAETFAKNLLGTAEGGNSEGGYENKESEVNMALDDIQRHVVDNWNMFYVLGDLKELGNKETWEKDVEKFSKPESYNDLAESAKDVLNQPFKPLQDHPAPDITKLTQATFSISGMAILFIVALQIIILLGYLLGMKTGGGRDKIVTSDTGATRSWSNTN